MDLHFDWEFFTYLNNYLIDIGIDNEVKCLAYWYNIDKCQTISYHVDKNLFNWQIYLKLNPDLLKLGIKSERDCLVHWYKTGKKENRSIVLKDNIIDHNIANSKSILSNNNTFSNRLNVPINISLKNLNDKPTNNLEVNDYNSKIIKKKTEKMTINLEVNDHNSKVLKTEKTNINLDLEKIDSNILSSYDNKVLSNTKPIIIRDNNDLKYDPSKLLINILTRTSQRKNYFSECRYSILNQTYKNIRHIVSVDDNESYEYVKKNGVEDINIVREIRKPRKSESHMPYNLYMNSLLEKVETGWILFLDDDDILLDQHSIQIIIKNLPDIPSIVIFKTEYANDVKPSKYFKKSIEKGDITSNCFIFHSKLKKYSYWNDVKGSDYFFLEKLSKNNNIFWLNKVLTKVNNLNLMGKGYRIDKNIEAVKYKNILLKNLFLSNKKLYLRKNFNRTCFLNNYFDHIYILSLERRTDKFFKTMNRLNNYGITCYERFIGVDGNLLENQKKYDEYLNKLNDKLNLKKIYIPSSGSYSILSSMKNMILDAKNRNLKRILVFQDDIIFHKEFNKLLLSHNELLNSDWGLIYLGASQHCWKKIKFENGYYIPINTDGAFAFGINSVLFDQLLELISTSSLPFDSGPLSYLQKLYPNRCFVLYPNLIISDVTDSDCRISRNQELISQKFRWNHQNYDFDFYLKKDLFGLEIINNLYTPSNLLVEMNDLVTVIIYSDVHEQNIEYSINSIINQSYKNLEILIIDNNTSNYSFNIIKNLSKNDKRIKYYKNKKNDGEFVSKNFGMKHSKGNYIIFHDSKDYSYKFRIEYQVSFLKNNPNFHGCLVSSFVESKKSIAPLPSTLCFRREVIDIIGYLDSVYFCADKEYMHRMILSKLRIYCIQKYLYCEFNNLINGSEKEYNYTEREIRKIYKFSYQNYFEKLKKKSIINQNDLYVDYNFGKKRLYKIMYTNNNQKKYLEVI